MSSILLICRTLFKSIRIGLIAYICTFFCACADDTSEVLNSYIGSLRIQVIANRIESKGAIFDTYLPDQSQVCVRLTDTKGNSYNSRLKETVEIYIADGESDKQLWKTDKPIPLDDRTAYVYASYPASDSEDGYLTIQSDQTDYLYGTPTTVSRTKPLASIVMNHALSIIEISCIKNNAFSGPGVISAFRVSSTATSSAAKWDTKTGKLDDFDDGANDVVAVSGLTLSDSPSVGHVIVIPKGETGEMTISVKVDDKWYSAKAAPISLRQGVKYHYDLSIGREYAEIGSVTETSWAYIQAGSETIEYGNFNINISGDRDNLAFAHSVANGEVTIKAVSLSSSFYPSEVSLEGDAILSQSLDDNRIRTVKVSSITSDVNVVFDGISGGELTIAGSTTGLSITKERTSDNSFRVIATPSVLSNYAKAPSISSGKATLDQNVSKFIRTIDVKNMKSNVVLNFNGTSPVTDLIKWDGDTSGLEYSASVYSGSASSNTIEVTVKPTIRSFYPKEASISSNGTINTTQKMSLDGSSKRTFRISMSDSCTIFLNGFVQAQFWSTINTDGVYYVAYNGCCAIEPSTDCIGVALVNMATNQKFIIEKYEDNGDAYKESQTYFNKEKPYVSSSYFTWGDTLFIEGVASGNELVTGCGTGVGTIGSTVSADPSQWIGGVLGDYKGLSNTNEICTYWLNDFCGDNPSPGWNSQYCPMGGLWLIILNKLQDEYYGVDGRWWYLPSCGQLGLIYLYRNEINNALTAIGGKPLSLSELSDQTRNNIYLSSTQLAGRTVVLDKMCYVIDFGSGYVGFSLKSVNESRVRFIRDVN